LVALGIRIPTDEAAWIRAYAAAKEISVNAAIAEAIARLRRQVESAEFEAIAARIDRFTRPPE
jgi:hypothetical protein